MNGRKALALLLLAQAWGFPKAAGADDVPNPEPYRRAFFATLENLNGALKSKGLPIVGVDPEQVRVVLKDSILGPKTVLVHVNPAFNVEFLRPTDRAKSPSIAGFYRDIPLSWLGSYDAPPKPVWNSERAVQEGKFWYGAVYGEPLAHVGAAETEFEDQMNLPKYREGEWVIRWRRIDAEGHRFQLDNIYCTLDEKFGVSFLSRLFVSTFAEGQKVLVSADQAMAVAQRAAQKLLAGPMTSAWPKGLTLIPEGKPETLIVNPNHLMKYKTPDEVPVGDVVARLAWVTKFRASDDKGSDAFIFLWIDTETKEVLGGDFTYFTKNQRPR